MRVRKGNFYDYSKSHPLSQEFHQRHQRRSRKVHLLRRVLGSAIVLMLTTIFVWPQVESALSYPSPQMNHGLRKAALQDHIHHPSMYAYDKDQRPYKVRADKAEQLKAELVKLERPYSHHTLEHGLQVEIQGKQGLFYEKTNLLNYENDVKLKTSNGYVFSTKSAQVNVNNKSVIGTDPIVGKGPTGEIVAQGFKIDEGGDRIHFTGKSKLIIYSPGKSDDPSE